MMKTVFKTQMKQTTNLLKILPANSIKSPRIKLFTPWTSPGDKKFRKIRFLRFGFGFMPFLTSNRSMYKLIIFNNETVDLEYHILASSGFPGHETVISCTLSNCYYVNHYFVCTFT